MSENPSAQQQSLQRIKGKFLKWLFIYMLAERLVTDDSINGFEEEMPIGVNGARPGAVTKKRTIRVSEQ